MDGNRLLEVGRTFTAGYTASVVDAQQGAMQQLPRFCVDKAVITTQLQDVVDKYLKEHPEERHNAGIWIVHMALSEAFPCKK